MVQAATRNAIAAPRERAADPLLRVLLIAPTLDGGAGGGQAKFGRLLCQELESRVDLLHLRVPYAGEVSGIARVVASAWLALRAMWLTIRRRVDVVHILSPCNRSGFYEKLCLALLCRLCGARTIFNFRNAFNYWFESWTTVERIMVPALLRANTVVLCQYEGLRSYLITRGVAGNAGRVRVLPNAIDPAEAVLSPRSESGSTVRIVFLGCVGLRKGTDILLQAVALLDTRLDAGCARFDIAGGPCRDSSPDFAADADRLPTRQLVSLLGPLDYRAKWHLLSQADIVVLPSRAEGFPNVILEAMLAGVPLVVSDVGAMPEVVGAHGCGLVFPRGDSRALARCLETLITDAPLRRRLGEAARHAAVEHYGLGCVMDQLVALYRQVASRAGAH